MITNGKNDRRPAGGGRIGTRAGAGTVYLDNAATTFPKPDSVIRAVENAMVTLGGNPGRSSHSLSAAAADAVYSARELIAAFFGSGKPENVIFTPNATAALNLAIKTLVPYPCHILISDIEHNSVLRPVAALAEKGWRYSVYRVGESDEETEENILRLLRRDTRLIAANHSSNICGFSQNAAMIGALCRERGISFVLDASQSAGMREIDMERDGIDALCCPGHKGLYGPAGSGFVLFGDRGGERAASAPTVIEGGSGINSVEPKMPGVLPERFEAGTVSVPCIMGLKQGIKEVAARGIPAIAEEENRLRRRIERGLAATEGVRVYRPDLDSGPIALFNIAGLSSEDAAAELDRRGVCVRAGLHCAPLAHRKLGTGGDGAVRASVGMFSSAAAADALIGAVREIAAQHREDAEP